MKKSALIPIIIIVGLLAVGGFILTMNSSSKPETTSQTTATDKPSSDSKMEVAAKPNEVQIKDFAFGPDTITVKKGTTVTWTNQDDARHDISPTEGAEDFTKSKLLAKGETHEFTFNTVGTYSYNCSPHPYMKAKVVVTE